jgi:hypothetical protein
VALGSCIVGLIINCWPCVAFGYLFVDFRRSVGSGVFFRAMNTYSFYPSWSVLSTFATMQYF